MPAADCVRRSSIGDRKNPTPALVRTGVAVSCCNSAAPTAMLSRGHVYTRSRQSPDIAQVKGREVS
ncbi:hypothetical protein W59_10539 [Rhodococcus opacus RKJ300 = JCM 13270]|uniref:Uncharacterized protein n=1 Tax=Rhodococcus opacus RKJ300 = JCM 13270 TaxID=1165867 RepID=I0WUB9_RHOOP|nr:hypothetical protein W59_10539 [Rhodococcus opacus RKJ300 = JCM 13270]